MAMVVLPWRVKKATCRISFWLMSFLTMCRMLIWAGAGVVMSMAL